VHSNKKNNIEKHPPRNMHRPSTERLVWAPLPQKPVEWQPSIQSCSWTLAHLDDLLSSRLLLFQAGSPTTCRLICTVRVESNERFQILW